MATPPSPPFNVPLWGDRGLDFVAFVGLAGVDYTGATNLNAKIRLKPDSASTAIVLTATMPYSGSATVSAHVGAGRMTPDVYKKINALTGNNYLPTDIVPFTQFKFVGAAADFVSPKVPNAVRVGDNVTMAWDFLITPSGGIGTKIFYGDFVVRGVVSHV